MIGRSVEAPEHSRVARHAHNLQPRVRIYLSSFISSLSLHEIFRSWQAGRQISGLDRRALFSPL